MRKARTALVSSAALFCVGYFFCTVCIYGGYSGFEGAMQGVSYLFLFIAPLSVAAQNEIKGYFQRVAFAALPFLPAFTVALACPLVIAFNCNISYGAAYTAIFGTLLFTAALVSLFSLVSVLAGDEKASLIISYILALVIYFRDSIAECLGIDTVFYYILLSCALLFLALLLWRRGCKRPALLLLIFGQLLLIISLFFDLPVVGIYSSLTPLFNSILDFGAFAALVLLIGVCFLLYLLVLSVRQNDGRRACTLALVTLAVFLFGNVGIDRLAPYLAVDASGKQLFTFSESGEKYLQSIERELSVYRLDDGGENLLVDGLVTELANKCEKITVHSVNIYERPSFAQQYTDEELLPHSLIISDGKNHAAVPIDEIISGEQNEIYNGEGAVLSAVYRVINGGAAVRVLGTLDGEYEKSLSSLGFKIVYADEKTEKQELAEDAVIVSTEEDISDETLSELTQYLLRGGRVILITEPYNDADPCPNISLLSEAMGIKAENGFVLDDEKCLIYPSYLLPEMGEHTITDGLEADGVVMPMGQPLFAVRDGIAYTPLLFTGDGGYVYYEDEEKEDGFYIDERGKICVAAMSTANGGGCLVRYTSSGLFSSDFDMTGENFSLLCSTLAYLCDVKIPPNTYKISLSLDALVLSSGAARALSVIFMCAFPSIPLILLPLASKKRAK